MLICMLCTAIDNTVVAIHALVNMDTNHVKGPLKEYNKKTKK